MPLGKPAPLNKRKKLSKIITDLSHINQDEYDSEPEASEFDLGTKIRTPKDIMLEELSLQNNKGSKMFRMRQKRVDRFIYENNPDVFSSESMDNLQKFVPSLGAQMGGDIINVGGHFVSKQLHFGGILPGGAPVPPPKPGSKGAGAGGAGGAEGAEGLGGGDHGKDEKGERASGWSPLKGGGGDYASKMLHLKTYVSPWEKAMKGDETLLATLRAGMPGPTEKKDLRKYKCFNRSAMPFGGFEKANQFMKFQLPETKDKEEPEPTVVYQHDIACRPSFNRTPIGWVGSSEPGTINMEIDTVAFDGETDEL